VSALRAMETITAFRRTIEQSETVMGDPFLDHFVLDVLIFLTGVMLIAVHDIACTVAILRHRPAIRPRLVRQPAWGDRASCPCRGWGRIVSSSGGSE